MGRTAALLTSLVSLTLLVSCTGSSDDASEPRVTAAPQGGAPAEEAVRSVLEEMGATGIGVVDTPGRGEAFVYGQVETNRSVVVHTLRKGKPTPGKTTGTVDVKGIDVDLVRTEQFGLVARFRCAGDTVDVWVRKGDQQLSKDKGLVLRQAEGYIAAGGCAG